MATGRSSIRDVAERAQVSVSTVSRILNGSYPPAPQTRQRVMQAVRDLDYVANPHARALTRHESDTVAVVVMMLDSDFLLQVVQSIANEVAAVDKVLLIGTTGGDATRELAVLRRMRDQMVGSIVLVGAAQESPEYEAGMVEFMASLERSGVRLVTCARPPVVPGPCVQYDSRGGAYAGTSYLVAAGHRRILLLPGPDNQSTTRLRREGYRAALTDLGVPIDEALEAEQSWSRDSGYATMKRALESELDFTAVLAYNDHIAAGAVRAVRERGLEIPRDLSVVGFGDTPAASDLELTSVHIPAAEVGRRAAQLALATEVPADNQVMLGTYVTVRSSVGPPAG